MIENGLGIGVMPLRAFELMKGGIGRGLTSVALNDAWAARQIRLVARDFSTLPVAARTLVEHLHRPAPTTALPDPLAA
jgi:DNA-binding transcriptional LysR family regulator